MISITIHNRGAHDLYVTVTDNNSRETPIAMKEGRVNYGSYRQVDVQDDGQGYGDIHWHSERTDDSTQTGEGDAQPSIGSQVDVDLD